MAIKLQEKHLFIFLVLVVSMSAFFIEPSYFMTMILIVAAVYFVSKTEKLKYYLILLTIILAIFVSLLMAS
ncbi:hypothetical protein NM897_17295 (plasmid) [Planococcus maritimus]|uniref:hypothetical protein n=1 Tax=Planococcus maritimus TaxID=192421 RepID=UPI0031389190